MSLPLLHCFSQPFSAFLANIKCHFCVKHYLTFSFHSKIVHYFPCGPIPGFPYFYSRTSLMKLMNKWLHSICKHNTNMDCHLPAISAVRANGDVIGFVYLILWAPWQSIRGKLRVAGNKSVVKSTALHTKTLPYFGELFFLPPMRVYNPPIHSPSVIADKCPFIMLQIKPIIFSLPK